MKKSGFPIFVFYCLLFVASLQTGFAQSTSDIVSEPKAVIAFDVPVHDFGDMKQGEKVAFVFKFKNTGKAPLIISNVQTTCGCTVPDWPKDPVAPGKTGQLSATFNSAGKSGKQNKVITVISNASNARESVTIAANVIPAKSDGNTPPVNSPSDKH